MRPPRIIFLGILLLWSASAPAATAPEAFAGLNRKWTYYQSPNFELYSARNERDSRDLLERMELLRALFVDTFKMSVRLPQPVTIYAFSAQKDFDAYIAAERRGKVTWGGFCLPQPDRTVITLAPSSSEDLGQIVYHEYIHCLFHMTELAPPPWMNEGVAEIFSTLREEKGWMHLGEPIPGRMYELKTKKLMPLEDLFAVDYDSSIFKTTHTGLFYSEAWAMIHYLQFGVSKIPPEKALQFLRIVQSSNKKLTPEVLRGVAKELLGADYPKLQADLEDYVNAGRYYGRKVRRPEIAAKSTYTMRAAPGDEMLSRLAELSLRFTRSGYANLAVRRQLESRPEPRLREVLGAMALQENEPDRAREQWIEAFEAGSTNVAICRELSRLEASLVFNRFDLDYRMPEERAARLRKLLHRSLEQAPDQSTGYEMLAWVEATAQTPDIPAVLRVQEKFGSLNNQPRVLLALAVVRLRLGRTEEALATLDQMNKLQPDDWVLFCMEITRARLEKRRVDVTKLPKFDASGPTMILTPPKLNLPR